MADKPDNPWWTKGDTLWGGETFEATKESTTIGVKVGDRFRVEKKPTAIYLIPDPANTGSWDKSQNKDHPIKLTRVPRKRNKRAFSMTVKFQGGRTQTLFVVERENRSVAITDNVDNPEQNGGTASVRR